MRAETRHQLKQDRFSRATMEAAEKTAHWTVEHRAKLLTGAVVALVALAAVLGTWLYLDRQDQRASVDLSKAVRTLQTPLRPADAPPQPDVPTFTSAKERAKAAHDQFQTVVDKYPYTHSGDIARYFLGLTSIDLGDTAAAERNLKEIAGSHHQDLAALAKFALASVYRNTNRDKDALELYKQLMDKPTRTVSKITAQMELAALYQAKQQPEEAKRIYEQIQKENPSTEAAGLAGEKLQEMEKSF